MAFCYICVKANCSCPRPAVPKKPKAPRKPKAPKPETFPQSEFPQP